MSRLECIINACQELLLSFEPAGEVQDYLDKRIPRDAQKKWGFGYFPPNQHLEALISIVGVVPLKEHNMIYNKITPEGLVLSSIMKDHNMVMPYRDQYSGAIGIVGRTILSENERSKINLEKYKNTHFKKGKYLFGLDEAKYSIIKNNVCIVVEGQIDCITAHDKGIQNVVAIGSSNLTFDQFALLHRYTNNIILLLDEDNAGQSGEDKIMKDFGSYASIRRAHLPMGVKDLDEYLKEIDMDNFELLIK